MSKKLKYTYSKSQPIENSSNFVELEPELFLNSKEFYKIIQTNYKKNNNHDIIFTPKSKSDKNNSSKSKDIDNQKIKVNIPLSTKNLTNIKLNFNDNIENKENKFRSNNILNINSQFKKETNKINNKNEKILNINDFNYKSNNKIIKLEKKNSNKSNKNEKKKEKNLFTLKKEKSYYSFSEISSLDLNKTSSDINTNNSIEY